MSYYGNSGGYGRRNNDLGAGGCLVLIVMILAYWALQAALIMELWNFIARQTGWPIIGYWVAAAIGVLCSLLFGGARAASR